MIIILVVVLSLLDGILTSSLIKAGVGVEVNPFCVDWLFNPWIRGPFTLLAGVYFAYKRWTWLLWIWALILAAIVLWNGTWWVLN